MKKYQDRFETDILPYVRKPQRYAGAELHCIVKPEAELQFAIAYPDLYEIAMSSLAVQILYHRINQSDPAVAGERVFLPQEDAISRLRETDTLLPTLETRTPLNQCDIVGVSISYEMALPGMLELLDLGGIPIHSAERSESDPIVIAGGPVAFNPEPFADFVDLVAVGDGEEQVVEISRLALTAKRNRRPRAEIIAGLAALDGIYQPGAHSPTEREGGRLIIGDGNQTLAQACLVKSLDANYYPDKPLLPLTEVTFDRISLEVMRGCTRGCRFCQAGTLYRPVRERPFDDVVNQAIANIAATGHNELSLTSLSTSDYSPLPDLIDALQEEFRGKGISLAFPSLRPDSFTPEMARAFPGSRKSGITFAPEAGTQRLRDVINKNSNEADLLRATELAFKEGYNSVKLYFMIGLPTETEADLAGIADLSAKVAKLRSSKRQRVTISVSPFAPKPHTPFERYTQPSISEFKHRLGFLRQHFRGVQARLSGHDPESALIETTIARGDRRMIPVIERVWKDGGILEAWYDRFEPERWWQAYRDERLDPAQLNGELAGGEALPWSHISKGVHERFNKREWKRASKTQITVDCRDGKCHGCGLEKMIPEKGTVCNSYPTVTSAAPHPAVETLAPTEVVVVARVRYTRSEELRWSGHLDFVRLWERILRRAEVPLAYSQGFHPHARLGFGPPLQLGLASNAEYVDISLHRTLEADDILSSINQYAPVGLRACEALVLSGRPKALSSIVRRISYRFPTPETENFEFSLNEFLAQDSYTITRMSKGKKKNVDLRRFVHHISQENEYSILHLNVIDGATARLDELASAWQADDAFLTTITRWEVLAQAEDTLVTPLELPDDILSRSGEVTV